MGDYEMSDLHDEIAVWRIHLRKCNEEDKENERIQK